ncbi:lipopolysaccharide biosynthesis protein [Amycolatopsis sp. CA-230715]|uniref:lipopolysaccharide biosynthesis protein n=1 Tax=Amycolatopsis sp. CA-230715 TaxID=2745196 RepID=UPI001C034308|nr:lipopolysaccharide biosynthesis protein [Amycolatopsis sp. CA-230715]QWF79803.1 Lipopolysaccharide biosynthesis protein WzxC [Amycolatopsis sp. CA-230715]
MTETKEKSLGSAIRWSAINSVVGRVCQVGVSILLARLIAPDQFGLFAVALVVLNIVLSVSEMGVSVALIRTPGDVKEIAPTVTTLSFASGTGLALLCVLGAPWFSAELNAPGAAGVIQLMSVALVISGASAVPGALLQRDFRQDHKAMADLAGFVAGTAVAVVLALTGFGAWSLAWSRIVTNGAAALVMFVLTKERYRPGFDRKQAKSLLAFGLPLAGSSLLVFGVLNIDYVVVGKLLGPVELAFYLLAFNLSSWPVGAISQPVRSVSLAAFSKVRDDSERFQRSFTRALGLLALFTIPACVLLATFGGPLVRFAYGERWSAAAGPLALLVVLGALRVALELAYDFLASAGKARVILWIHLLWFGSLVPVLALGGHLGGIRGVAAGHIVVALLLVSPAYLIALRPFGIRVRALASALARPAAGGALMALAGLGAQWLFDTDVWRLVVGGLVAIAVYAVVVLPMRHEALRVLRNAAG